MNDICSVATEEKAETESRVQISEQPPNEGYRSVRPIPGIDKSSLINFDGGMERAKKLIVRARRVGPLGDEISLDSQLAEPVCEVMDRFFRSAKSPEVIRVPKS